METLSIMIIIEVLVGNSFLFEFTIKFALYAEASDCMPSNFKLEGRRYMNPPSVFPILFVNNSAAVSSF